MRRILLVLMAALLALTVVGASPAVAKKPMRGDIYMMPLAECGDVAWSGTVDFGGGDGHGIYLSATGVDSVYRGQTMHYEEYFTVTDQVLAPGSCPTGSEPVLLIGWPIGDRVFANDTVRDNGVVTDTGLGFEMWDGRQNRMSGDVLFVEVAPDVFVPTLDGVLQLN